MAEHVRNSQDGLHFAPNSAASLQEQMELVCRKPQIWAGLQQSLAERCQQAGLAVSLECFQRKVI